MNLHTSLSGRLRNTNLPKTNVLYPLFEAVINSIHSIDERVDSQKDFTINDAEIRIEILRSGQTNITNERSDIIGFKITDNGIGFNEANYESFQTLDSEYKMSKGCRGIGRLLWLKAFQYVSVDSTFEDNNKIYHRTFIFNAKNDIENPNISPVDSSANIQTIVTLHDIGKDYLTYLPKTLSIISRSILEHCLWYFLRNGSAPKIVIQDGEEEISLNDEYDSYMLNAATSDSITIKGKVFDITHVKLKINSINKNSVFYSAANRLVCNESLKGKIPGLFGNLHDEEEEFNYLCFVSSDYLTQNVTPERLGFNIPEQYEGALTNTELSFSEIRNEVIKKIETFLDSYLTENKVLGEKRLVDFINNRAPRYHSILSRLETDEKYVDPDISDKDLELKLHGHLVKMENELIEEGHDILIPRTLEKEEDYINRINKYISKAKDLKQSDLANYVCHRRVIIELLAKALRPNADGRYCKEEVIHNLIMQMQKNSNELFENESNLWLLDERLAFHTFLSSDRTIKSMSITDSESTKEPDLLSLNIYDNPLLINDGESLPLASITVVEIKRPMRNDAKPGEVDKDPIIQALDYLENIREGHVKTSSGRLIPESNNIPGFCYVLCDMTENIKKCCKGANLLETSDKLGYFGYNNNYKAYIEVISFDRLLNNAIQRNKAFFDKLGLPTN